jgi:hypothetical protein
MIGAQIALFCIARHLGRTAGNDDVRRGVGDGPVGRPVLVATPTEPRHFGLANRYLPI